VTDLGDTTNDAPKKGFEAEDLTGREIGRQATADPVSSCELCAAQAKRKGKGH